ncbi:MAG: protein kinase domain-containing protein [Persicimonas sp.]
MSATEETIEYETVARMLETRGVEDRPMAVEATLTMHPEAETLAVDQNRMLPRLPRLTESNVRQTLPELRFKETLGEGGMGLVKLADQLPLGRDVAVKGLRERAKTREMRLALLREGWTTGLLEHPNIVPVYSLGRDEDGEPIIVMKCIEGVSWSELLRDPSRAPREFESDSPLDWHIEILMQVCNAIHFAHSKGIIHRDLKPENVMIGEFGEVYVLDWGVAVSLERDPDGRLPSVETVDSPVGTPAYMAPEMVAAEADKLSPRTDVYLLGAMLHQVLTGHPPHRGETLYQVMYQAYESQQQDYDASVPERLRSICTRAMAVDPADRFASAEAFRQALLDYKRHSEAQALASEARQRLDHLRELTADDEAHREELYEVFGESRFGFEQALRVEPESEAARDGLQMVLETVADWELERGAYQAASLHISELPEPNPELQERLDKLGEELASREEEYEQLQEFRREVDPNIGRTSRSKFVAFIGSLWAVATLLRGLADDLLGIEIDYASMIPSGVVVLVLISAVLFWARRPMTQNELNRRMVAGFYLMLVGGIAFRVIGWRAGIDVHAVLALEMFSYGIGGGVLALALDRRILWAAVPLAIGAVVASLMPDAIMYISGGASFLAMILLAYAFWPRTLIGEIY